MPSFASHLRLTVMFVGCLGLALMSLPACSDAGSPPKNLLQAYGKLFALGTALPDPNLSPEELQLLLANFTNLTPENCMKPQATEPEEGKYTFARGDALADFAQQHGLKINGHCLIWHNECPAWFFLDGAKPASRELVLKRMIDHITTVAGHFRGKVVSWDVVNEALGRGPDYPPIPVGADDRG